MIPTRTGVPRSLQHAIYRTLCVGPISDVMERGYETLKQYIEAKFEDAILKNPDCREELYALLDEVTRREFKEKAITLEEWKKLRD